LAVRSFGWNSQSSLDTRGRSGNGDLLLPLVVAGKRRCVLVRDNPQLILRNINVFEGIKNLSNLGAMLKQAQEMGGKLQAVNERLKSQRARGSAGGGMVSVDVNGLGEVIRCSIDPALIEQRDRELIEDLLPAAVNQALAKARELHAASLKEMASGFEMPGLQDAIAQLSAGAEGTPPSASNGLET
jgi:nucleoid-associated protein EbfC